SRDVDDGVLVEAVDDVLGSLVVNVGRRVREISFVAHTSGEVIDAFVEFVVADSGRLYTHGVEDIKGGLVILRRGRVGRRSDIVTGRQQSGAGIVAAGAVFL